jgi:hypothetical protein
MQPLSGVQLKSNEELILEDDAEAEESDEEDREYDGLAKPENACRRFCWEIATHSSFDTTILLCICTNVGVVIVSMIYTEGIVYQLCEVAEYTFTAVYTLEAVIKITAFGFAGYWADNWNKFDFLLVVLSSFEICCSLLLNDSVIPIPPTMARGLRTMRVILRIARVVGRLVRAWHLAQVAASARNIGIARPTKVITKKDTVMLAYGEGQEGMLLEAEQDEKAILVGTHP